MQFFWRESSIPLESIPIKFGGSGWIQTNVILRMKEMPTSLNHGTITKLGWATGHDPASKTSQVFILNQLDDTHHKWPECWDFNPDKTLRTRWCYTITLHSDKIGRNGEILTRIKRFAIFYSVHWTTPRFEIGASRGYCPHLVRFKRPPHKLLCQRCMKFNGTPSQSRTEIFLRCRRSAITS